MKVTRPGSPDGPRRRTETTQPDPRAAPSMAKAKRGQVSVLQRRIAASTPYDGASPAAARPVLERLPGWRSTVAPSSLGAGTGPGGTETDIMAHGKLGPGKATDTAGPSLFPRLGLLAFSSPPPRLCLAGPLHLQAPPFGSLRARQASRAASCDSDKRLRGRPLVLAGIGNPRAASSRWWRLLVGLARLRHAPALHGEKRKRE
ncbi:hypothetical protein CDD83_4673 [Cordyceps sp. RAO-2017]|nr:hypothetical protein CDD83_4673 [Cordyceps sp. RAO-2017]